MVNNSFGPIDIFWAPLITIGFNAGLVNYFMVTSSI